MDNRADYDWDVFVSYRYYHGLLPWIEDHFVPLLKIWLSLELDEPEPRIFLDKPELRAQKWTDGLANALATSAVLVPLLSKNYFASGYCEAEFNHMVTREQESARESLGGGVDLVLPAIVHDCDPLPVKVGPRNCTQLFPFVLANLAPQTNTAVELEQRIKDWAPLIAGAIAKAPPPSSNWLSQALAAMQDAYDQAPARQETVPGRRPL